MVELLRNAGIFASLQDEELQLIHENSEYLTVPEGGVLFTPEDEGNALYVLASGQIAISRSDGEDAGREIARFVPGDSFGELDLLLKNRHNATARAIEEAEILVFPRKGLTFEEICVSHPATFAPVLFKLLAVIASRLRSTNRLISQNSSWVRQLQEQVYKDKLTSFYNKAYLHEELPRLLKERGEPVSLLFVKPDNFKMVNDTYGHEVGDKTLVRFAKRVAHALPEEAIAVRYRGNEIAAILPGADAQTAMEVAGRAREALASTSITDLTGGGEFQLSASASYATIPDDGTDAEQIIAATNETVYSARSAGGGKVWHITDREEHE
ncbi:MAG: GGDEF domain-containing protein [Alkalispirochaetaceae bacterium]